MKKHLKKLTLKKETVLRLAEVTGGGPTGSCNASWTCFCSVNCTGQTQGPSCATQCTHEN